ncbi:MAG TPA: hypothetical protein VFR37_08550 [Longimicrobium sp.]|nr:hypothetical protein [Longimicrobium sp.]
MRPWIVAGTALLLASSSTPVQERRHPPESRCEAVDRSRACTLYGVSIIELIASPRLYDGKRVRVMGWLHLEFEGNGIYLHRDDELHGLYRNGLWVSFASGSTGAACARGYALVEGRFNAASHGHLGMWSGAIEHIDRCIRWR